MQLHLVLNELSSTWSQSLVRHVFRSSRIRSWLASHAIIEAPRSIWISNPKYHGPLHREYTGKPIFSLPRCRTLELTFLSIVRICTHPKAIHPFQESPWNTQTWRPLRRRFCNPKVDRASQERRTTHKQCCSGWYIRCWCS